MNLYKLITAVFFVTVSVLLFADKYEAEAATITVSGDTLTYKGGVDEGDAKKFKKLFTSSIKHLVLNSPGGYMKEALKMSKLISKRYDVTISTKKVCTSACAVMWLSGNSQTEPKEKVVGFHLPYLPKFKDIKAQQDRYGLNGLEYMFKGSALRFLVNVTPYIDNLSATHLFTKGLLDDGLLRHNMWFPTVSELRTMEGKFSIAKLAAPSSFSLSDSRNWDNHYGIPVMKTRWSSTYGLWVTKVTFLNKRWKDKVSAKLYTGNSKNSVTRLKVAAKHTSEIRFSGVYRKNIGPDNKITLTLHSKEKPKFVLITDGNGNYVYN